MHWCKEKSREVRGHPASLLYAGTRGGKKCSWCVWLVFGFGCVLHATSQEVSSDALVIWQDDYVQDDFFFLLSERWLPEVIDSMFDVERSMLDVQKRVTRGQVRLRCSTP